MCISMFYRAVQRGTAGAISKGPTPADDGGVEIASMATTAIKCHIAQRRIRYSARNWFPFKHRPATNGANHNLFADLAFAIGSRFYGHTNIVRAGMRKS